MLISFTFLVLTSQTAPVKELARKSRLALINYSKNDHAQIGQTLMDILSPRLDSQVKY